ncbi:MAG: hypothetical protein AUK44_04000 [Porphyromonadaceae bacterium CG2_30_38_12]|nr:MAG: hypothetical protein AUK44_04000 [Porphyromonadaceae bacterium CG2_30_38_12]
MSKNGYSKIYWLLLVIVFVACKPKNNKLSVVSNDLETILTLDTLRVGTIQNAVSYFYYRDEPMGFDYELAQNLASTLKVNLKVIRAQNEQELIDLLENKRIDIAAYNFNQTKELKKKFQFVVPLEDAFPVLVQKLNIKTITNNIDLKDKTITIEKHSVFEQQLHRLNDATGNTFNIELANDSLTQEDLIEKVASGKLAYTIAYSKIAKLYKIYYSTLDIRLQLGNLQRNGWLISKQAVHLVQAVETWNDTPETEILKANLSYKYLRNSLYFNQKKFKIPKGSISPYDHWFKKYAKEINWDWQLVAAIAFHESRFDSSQRSWAGAAGLMQLMPRTATNLGLNRSNILIPEKNIEAGVQYIKSLNLIFARIENKQERIKFILASYNSGPAHILDAQALAKKHGKNPSIWFGHVEEFLLKESEPIYYNDPVVKYGRFRGKETAAYVEKIMATAEKYKRK